MKRRNADKNGIFQKEIERDFPDLTLRQMCQDGRFLVNTCVETAQGFLKVDKSKIAGVTVFVETNFVRYYISSLRSDAE